MSATLDPQTQLLLDKLGAIVRDETSASPAEAERAVRRLLYTLWHDDNLQLDLAVSQDLELY